MSWNRQDLVKSVTRKSASPVARIGLFLFGCLFLAIVGIVLFVEEGAPTVEADHDVRSTKALAVKSSIAHSSQAKVTPTNVQQKTSRPEHLKKLQDRFYAEALEMDPSFAERLEKYNHWKKTRPFHNLSEIEIAAVISARPGDFVLMSDFHPDLEIDFLAHLDDPIRINDDDTDEVKTLKQQMIALKPQLKRQMDKGEKLANILNDYRKEMQKVYQLKSNLEDELRQIKKKATSVEEVEDFVAAANKMLEEYGTEEIKMPLTKSALEQIKLNAENSQVQGGSK